MNPVTVSTGYNHIKELNEHFNYELASAGNKQDKPSVKMCDVEIFVLVLHC